MMYGDDKGCTVGELIEHLKQFPANLPVIFECCSDYAALNPADVKIKKGVPKQHWVMRVYEEHIATMSKENRDGITEFVAFPGN
jgi:hypothetical protein